MAIGTQGIATQGIAIQGIAVFDLDRTVTRQSTFTPFLLAAARRDPIKLLQVAPILVAVLAYRLGLISRGRVKEVMLGRILGGTARAQVADISTGFVDRVLARGLRPGAKAAIDQHRAAGDLLVLATASFDFYVEELARRLGFDRVVCTRAVWDADDRLTGRIDGENCYGEVKLEMLLRALAQDRARLRVTAYSDHQVDVPLLAWADTPYAVNPSASLRAWAERRGAAVLNWQAPRTE